jgi:hypothetical protein
LSKSTNCGCHLCNPWTSCRSRERLVTVVHGQMKPGNVRTFWSGILGGRGASNANVAVTKSADVYDVKGFVRAGTEQKKRWAAA